MFLILKNDCTCESRCVCVCKGGGQPNRLFGISCVRFLLSCVFTVHFECGIILHYYHFIIACIRIRLLFFFFSFFSTRFPVGLNWYFRRMICACTNDLPHRTFTVTIQQKNKSAKWFDAIQFCRHHLISIDVLPISSWYWICDRNPKWLRAPQNTIERILR